MIFVQLAALLAITAQGQAQDIVQVPEHASGIKRPTGSVQLTLNCGEQPPVSGHITIRGPEAKEVLNVPIGPNGTILLPPPGPGWVQLLDVNARSEDGASWCLDPPIAVPTGIHDLTLQLRPAFTISTFGPKLPHMWASGTAVLIREEGIQCARRLGSCVVEETFGQIKFHGLRRGNYRIVLPWTQGDYVSVGQFRLDGPARPFNELGFGPVQLGEAAAKEAMELETWPGGEGQGVWRGKVVESNGKPVPHAVVRLVRADLRGPRVPPPATPNSNGDSIEVIADETGQYELRGVRGGTYLVGARPQYTVGNRSIVGHAVSNAGAPVGLESVVFPGDPEGQGAAPFEFTTGLPRVGNLTGKVTGAAPEGLRVIARHKASFGWLETGLAADGSFRFEGAAEGDYDLHLCGSTHCLRAPVAAHVPGPVAALDAIEGVTLDIVAPFGGTRPSFGWLQVIPLPEGPRPWAAYSSTEVHWKGIGVASVDGLPPGRYRITFHESADTVTKEALRFATRIIEIPRGPKKSATTQLRNFSSKKLTLFNDDADHSIEVHLSDPDGPLLTVEVPAASHRTVTVPIAFFKEIPHPLTASVRTTPDGEPWSKPIADKDWQLHYPGAR